MAATTTNTLLTITAVTRKALMILKNNLKFAMSCSKPDPRDNLWNQRGRKAGTTIYLRKPARYVGRSGMTASYENTVESEVPATISVYGVDTSFTRLELATDIDDYTERILVPKMATIYNYVDYTGLGHYTEVANSIGVIGTPPSTAMDLLTAGAIISENGFPDDGQRYCALSPLANASMVNGLKGLFNDKEKLAEMFRTGQIGNNVEGFGQIYASANVNTHTTGVQDGAYLTNGVSADGDYHIDIDTGTGAVVVGDVLTIGTSTTKPVFNVNPQNRSSTGRLKQFVARQASAGGGVALALNDSGAVIAPALGGAHTMQDSGAYQNMNAHIQDGAVVNWAGENNANSGVSGGAASAANVSQQNLAYHKSAFLFGCIPFDSDTPGAESHQESSDGVILNFSTQYNIDEGENKARFDCAFCFATPYPEGAVRIWG